MIGGGQTCKQLTCNIDLSRSFYYHFFSFVLLELKPFVLKGKVLGEKYWKSPRKSVKNSETILPFSCCPLDFPWRMRMATLICWARGRHFLTFWIWWPCPNVCPCLAPNKCSTISMSHTRTGKPELNVAFTASMHIARRSRYGVFSEGLSGRTPHGTIQTSFTEKMQRSSHNLLK